MVVYLGIQEYRRCVVLACQERGIDFQQAWVAETVLLTCFDAGLPAMACHRAAAGIAAADTVLSSYPPGQRCRFPAKGGGDRCLSTPSAALKSALSAACIVAGAGLMEIACPDRW